MANKVLSVRLSPSSFRDLGYLLRESRKIAGRKITNADVVADALKAMRNRWRLDANGRWEAEK